MPSWRSSSGLRTWRKCRREWWYRHCLGASLDTTEKQGLGNDVEAAIVGYLQGKGIDVDSRPGRIALAALPYLPPPLSARFVFQHHLTIAHKPGCPPITNIGALDPPAGFAYFEGNADIVWYDPSENVVWLYDIKSTSNLAWAMSDEEFAIDPQRVIYAAASSSRYNAPVVCQWVYVETYAPPGKPHRAMVRERLETPAEALAQLDALYDDQMALHAIDRANADEHSLPRNLLACYAFNGCGYAPDCCAGIPPWQRLAGVIRQRVIRDARRDKGEGSDQ